MATQSTPLTAFDRPPTFSCGKDPETGKVYYLDHTNETTARSHARDNLPPDFECRFEPATEKKYYVNLVNKTTYCSHPPHRELYPAGEPDLPYPHEQCLDSEGRHFYRNHVTQISSWMHPIILAELRVSGVLDVETDTYGGEEGQPWKAWIRGEIAECGPKRGFLYFVNYRTGDIEWASPEMSRIWKEEGGGEESRERGGGEESRSPKCRVKTKCRVDRDCGGEKRGMCCTIL